MKSKRYLWASSILLMSMLCGCMGLAGFMQRSSKLTAGRHLSEIYPDWQKNDRCTKCHMAWTWEYGYYRGWDRHGFISDYSTVAPAGYKDPYGLDVPVNTFSDYYYTDWWNGEWLESHRSSEPEMHMSGYGRINDGTAKPSDLKGRVIIVDQSGNGDAKTVQGGVDKALSGDTVFVRPGTYKELVTLKEGITLWGEDAYTTVIDSENKGSVIKAANGCDISGFTLTGTGFDYSEDRFRAAVFAVDCDSTLVIRGNIFFSNSVFGVVVESSRTDGYTINSADRFITPENALDNLDYSGYPNPLIIGNVFYNIGERAIYCIHSAPEIANNIFMGNLKTLGMTQLSKPFIHHNIFYRNTVSININRSMPIVTNNIMIKNYWGQRIMEGSFPYIRNNITWDSPYYNEFDEHGRRIRYKLFPGDGEREIDPMFIDMDGGDFRYSDNSPLKGKNRRLTDAGLLEGPGIQLPPTIACEYSWAEEFLNRTDETNAIIAAIDDQNELISSIECAYSVIYSSFMNATYDSSGNQISYNISDAPVSGTRYETDSWRLDGEKRFKHYTSDLFNTTETLSDSGTVTFDGRRVHILSGKYKPDVDITDDANMIGELPTRENIGGLYLDYDQYLNGSIGPAGTYFFGYLRILGGEVLEEREIVDGHECVVARYPHLGRDQVYKFYLDPALDYRPRRLEQYFQRKLYRRIDNYRYVEDNGVCLPVYARVTDYCVKEDDAGRVIGVTEMRVDPGALRLNGNRLDSASVMPETLDHASYAKNNTYVPPPREKHKKKKD